MKKIKSFLKKINESRLYNYLHGSLLGKLFILFIAIALLLGALAGTVLEEIGILLRVIPEQ
jgi:hypothetical protein